jgi:nucleotide-binding universal stress UspA family protein
MGTAADAVEWAAAEAASCDRPLVLVNAWSCPPTFNPYGVATAADDCRDYQAVADAVLQEAYLRACWVAPEVEITTVAVMGPVAAVLSQVGSRAHQVVLGGSGPRRTHRLPSGSVAGQVAGRATYPVTVVRPLSATSAGPSSARVVVGVGDSSTYGLDLVLSATLRYAFQAASRRRTALTALRACTGAGAEVRSQLRLVRSAVQELQRVFPAVPVEAKVVEGKPYDVLLTESRGAALTVVGGGRARFGRPAGSSLSRRLLGRTGSPLTIVGSPH